MSDLRIGLGVDAHALEDGVRRSSSAACVSSTTAGWPDIPTATWSRTR